GQPAGYRGLGTERRSPTFSPEADAAGSLEREGAYYLFTLRLFPAAPFFVINVVMGLTSIRVWTFWWVSQLGMLAGTIVYINAGASLPSLQAIVEEGATGILKPRLVISFVILGVFPLIVKFAMSKLRSRLQKDT
ncbi:MAG: hypothetical protein COB10_13085, partial [Planctomycetota bacterium]